MPIEVNISERSRRIGEAGMSIMQERGIDKLTIRAVADALGGSTSLVTNFVRNRSELLDLVLETLAEQWDAEAAGFEGPAGQRLRQTAEWALDWRTGLGPAVASITVQILGEEAASPRREAFLRQELDRLHARLSSALAATGAEDSGAVADLLYLASRGAMLTQVENPGSWPADRFARVADHLVQTLSA